MAVWTNQGLVLLATSLQTNGADVAPTWVAVGTGCGTLASPLTSGSVYTSLALDAALPQNVAAGQSLTITDGTSVQTVTCPGGATAGATSITVTSFTASATFAAHVSGVCPTPGAADLTLYNEVARVPVSTGAAGGTPGESLVSAYFDGTQATNTYMQVGYFGGTATSTSGSGTLMIEDVQFWSHVVNADSATFQADATI